MSQPENREISDSRSSYSITSTDSIDASPAYSDYKQFACDACFISSTSQSNHAPHICSKETLVLLMRILFRLNILYRCLFQSLKSKTLFYYYLNFIDQIKFLFTQFLVNFHINMALNHKNI